MLSSYSNLMFPKVNFLPFYLNDYFHISMLFTIFLKI